MKRLLLDIGNTRLKWSLAEGTQRGPAQAVVHDGRFEAVLEALPRTALNQIEIASVFSEDDNRRLGAMLDQRYRCLPRFARVRSERDGLRIAYTRPQRLGIDRWLMMHALWRRTSRPFIVASAGTALTVDLVDATGQHLGGYIAPGIATMQLAVLGATRFEHAARGEAPAPAPGTDTESCVRNAALSAALGLIERVGADMEAGERVLTGGDATLLLRFLGGRWTVHADLVLDALAEFGPG